MPITAVGNDGDLGLPYPALETLAGQGVDPDSFFADGLANAAAARAVNY